MAFSRTENVQATVFGIFWCESMLFPLYRDILVVGYGGNIQ